MCIISAVHHLWSTDQKWSALRSHLPRGPRAMPNIYLNLREKYEKREIFEIFRIFLFKSLESNHMGLWHTGKGGIAVGQIDSAFCGHQRCCSSGAASQKVRPYLNPNAR